MSAMPNPVVAPANVLSLLDQLHAESRAQEAAIGDFLSESFDIMRDRPIFYI